MSVEPPWYDNDVLDELVNTSPDMAIEDEDYIFDHLFPPILSPDGEIEVKRNPELVKCPKADKCVMDCYHKKPHVYEEKYCNDADGPCGIKCVHELISYVTFFEEDFEID